MAKKTTEKKVKKERTLGGSIGLALLTLAFPPAGAAVIISDYTKTRKADKEDSQRHQEIDTLITLEKDKAKETEVKTEETKSEETSEETKEES